MKVKSAEFVKSAIDPSQYPEDMLPEVAFVGRSNVGKSSLINTLVNRKRLAKTSNTPGRTQLINFFLVNDKVLFVDLPGYGYAKVPLEVKKQWGPMVERYLKTRKNLRMVVLILDIRRDPTEDDLSLLRWLYNYGIKPVFVLTKSDKLSKNRISMRRRAIGGILEVSTDALVTFSARTREGMDKTWKVIENSIT